jgi:hypothetical protein
MAERTKRKKLDRRSKVPVLVHFLWEGQDPATVCGVITRDEWTLLQPFNLSRPYERVEEVQRDTAAGRLLRRMCVYITVDGELVEDEGHHTDDFYPVEPGKWVGRPYRHIFCYVED